MAAIDKHGTKNPGLNSPARGAFSISKHDTNELPFVTRGIYVGGAGDMTVVMQNGDTVLFAAIPAGSVLPICVKKVKSAGTDATSMVGLY